LTTSLDLIVGSSKYFFLKMKPQPPFLLLLLVVVALAFSGCKKQEEQKVAVPNLVGQDLDQAEKALGSVSLKPGNISGVQGAPPPGTYVVSQTPAFGQQVASNTAVDLVVAAPILVPPVTGEITEAVSALQNAGLKVAFQRHTTMNLLKKAKVERQDPAANTPVHQGTIVMLTVTTPSVDLGTILGLVSQEPAYQKLNPEYKNILDAFIGNPTSTREVGMPEAPSTPGSAASPGTSSPTR